MRPNQVTCAEDCRAYGANRFRREGMCNYWTPILIDAAGYGLDLTDAAGGVRFAPKTGGALVRLSWARAVPTTPGPRSTATAAAR